jgi:hypothetical protein
MAETTEKKQTVKMVLNPLPPEEIYVDGVSAIIGRPGVIKLECYRAMGVDREANAEIRTVTHRLVLPAAVLPELVGLFQKMAEAGQRAAEARAAEAWPGDGGAEKTEKTS